MSEQQLQTLLTMLKNDLELIFDYMDDESRQSKEAQLTTYIYAAINFIETEGIELKYENFGDLMLITMYASWLYDKRKDGVAVMPRMLRYNLNNRLFSQKVNDNA